MTYHVTFHEHPSYLHATVTGDNTRNNVTHYLKDVLRECQTRGYRHVLIEECLDGPRLGTLDVFEIAADGSAEAASQFRAIAYVDVKSGGLMKFAETVAVNRGVPVRAFATVPEAEAWITQKVRAGPDSSDDTH